MKEEIQVVTPFNGITFNSHKTHNPHYDILEGKIDDDTTITYYICVVGPNKGSEGMEYYRGENYVITSKLKSYSRNYSVDQIPVKYKKLWEILKSVYPNLPK